MNCTFLSFFQICTAIMRLTLNELLDLGSMQTDPNWANFLYNPRTRQVIIFYKSYHL